MYEDFVELCQRGDAVAAGQFLKELSDLDRQQAIAFNDCASLFWSIANGNLEVAKLLFEKSSENLLRIFFSNLDNTKAFSNALDLEKFEIIRIFVRNCPKDLINNFLTNIDLELRKKVLSWAFKQLWADLYNWASEQSHTIVSDRLSNPYRLDFSQRDLRGRFFEVVSPIIKSYPLEYLDDFILSMKEYEVSLIFQVAAKNNDVDLVSLLIDKCGNTKNREHLYEAGKFSAFLLAANNGSTEVVKLLIEKCPTLQMLEEIYEAGMEDGYYFDAFNSAAENGWTEMLNFLIHKCPTSQMLEEMFESEDFYAFRMAAQNGNAEVVKLLIDKCPTSQMLEKMFAAFNFDAFNIAAQNCNTEVVKLLKEKCPTPQMLEEMLAAFNFDAFNIAAQNGQVEAVKLMLEDRPEKILKQMLTVTDENGDTAFICAAKLGTVGVVKLLIEKCPQNLLDQIVKDNILKCITDAKNSRRFLMVDFLLGFIEENYTANGSNQMLEKAVETLNGTAYGDMDFVMSIIAQRKELKRQNPLCNIDEFNEHIFKLSQNPDLGKLLLTCKSLTAGIGVSNIGCFDIYPLVIDNIAGFKTYKTTIDRQLESIQSVMLKNDFDLSPRTREFSYEVCKNYLFNC